MKAWQRYARHAGFCRAVAARKGSAWTRIADQWSALARWWFRWLPWWPA